MRNYALRFVLVCGGLLIGSIALSCPFCLENKGNTLVKDFTQTDMVLVGKFVDFKGKGFEFESTFRIDKVLKPHAFLKGKSEITVPGAKNAKNTFMIFVDVVMGDLDAYRGVELVDKSDMLDYLTGALKLAGAPPGERLRYAFNFLQSPDFEVSLDSYREFAQADYADYKGMAKDLPPDTIAGWLQDPKTPPYRYGLYASLLGHAGLKDPERYGKALKDMIDEPEKRKGSGIDGLLAGYAMLQPAKALDYLQKQLANPKTEYLFRYSCLSTTRFLWELRPDLIPDKELVNCMLLVSELPDMADFAIEDLRRWNRWEVMTPILALMEKESHDTMLIRRAVLRYALHAKAQGNEQAKTFVAAQDLNWVRMVLEVLERGEDLKTAYKRAK